MFTASTALIGTRALVTGSSRGIGRGIALRLAERGAHVAVHYHERRDAAEKTLAAVREFGSDGIVLQADSTRPDTIAAMVDDAADQLGGLDVFVANARPDLATFYLPPLEIGSAQWDVAMDSQAKAFLLGSQAAARRMAGPGRIVAVTYAPSARTGGWQPWVAMGAAKAALEALVRYFAVALAERGITVNCVSPGATFGGGPADTTVLDSLPGPVQDLIRGWHRAGWTPMRRTGTPADVGDVVALLCAPEAGFVTGQTIHADGGASVVDAGFPLEVQLG